MLQELLGSVQGFSIPVPVTLVSACACAYLLGKVPSDWKKVSESTEETSKTVRGKRLVDRLAGELNLLREDLLVHDESVKQLLDAIVRLENGSHVEIDAEAAQALRSIKKYVTDFQQNFDSIQATTATAVNMLMADKRAMENGPTPTTTGKTTVATTATS